MKGSRGLRACVMKEHREGGKGKLIKAIFLPTNVTLSEMVKDARSSTRPFLASS